MDLHSESSNTMVILCVFCDICLDFLNFLSLTAFHKTDAYPAEMKVSSPNYHCSDGVHVSCRSALQHCVVNE